MITDKPHSCQMEHLTKTHFMVSLILSFHPIFPTLSFPSSLKMDGCNPEVRCVSWSHNLVKQKNKIVKLDIFLEEICT